jgi:hypothetical protein
LQSEPPSLSQGRFRQSVHGRSHENEPDGIRNAYAGRIPVCGPEPLDGKLIPPNPLDEAPLPSIRYEVLSRARPVLSRFGGKSSVRRGHSRRGQVVRPKLEWHYLGNCGFYRKGSTDHFNENTGRIVRYVTCLTFESANVCDCCEAAPYGQS